MEFLLLIVGLAGLWLVIFTAVQSAISRERHAAERERGKGSS